MARYLIFIWVSLFGLDLCASARNNNDVLNYASKGRWGDTIYTGVVSVHLVLLPNGKVITWEEGGQGAPLTEEIRLFDPLAEVVTTPSLPPYDIFCSGHSVMPDGRLLVQGGHDDADSIGQARVTIYDPFKNKWLDGIPPMNGGRWYATNTILPDGDVLVLNGTDDNYADKNLLPQILDIQTKTWRNLSDAISAEAMGLDFYPRMFVMPNGKVFKAGPDNDTWILDTAGTGKWTRGPDMNWGNLRSYSSSVMYEEGKILISGGGDQPPTRTAEIIDLNVEEPRWEWAQPMHYRRRHHNLTILADGKILTTGGTASNGFNEMGQAVLEAELWDPETGEWQLLAKQSKPRVYHSTAILLPDARVLVGGGGRPKPEGGVDNHDIEIFSPPYLFKGRRPEIVKAPASVSFDEEFLVKVKNPNSITAVNLIRLGAATHAFNQTQGINRLEWQQTEKGLRIRAPSTSVKAQPGYYMLFVLDDGVPSVASIVQLIHSEKPATPEQIIVEQITSDSLKISWSPISHNAAIEAYDIFVNGDLHQSFSTTSATIADLDTGTEYRLAISARDLHGNESDRSEFVTVKTSNKGENSPNADAGDNQIVDVGEVFLLDASLSSDVDGDQLSFVWKLNDIAVSRERQFESSLNVAGLYQFRLEVSDGKHQVDDTVQVIVEGLTEELNTLDVVEARLPIARAGIDRTTFAGYTVTLNASGSENFSRTPHELSYRWEQISGPHVNLDELEKVRPSFTPEQAGEYKFDLYVYDGEQLSKPDSVIIDVIEPPAIAPVAVTQKNFSASLGDEVILDGSSSYDLDSDKSSLRFRWQQIAGPKVILSDPTSINTSFVPQYTDMYRFKLLVDDGELNSEARTIDHYRSLFVTHVSILNKFPLHRVLQKLLDDSQDAQQSPADVILALAEKRNGCDSFNGYPQADNMKKSGSCSEPGIQLDEFEANIDPELSYYKPIALINRFDLADKAGANCGEFRVAYAGNNIIERRVNFFIFEAVLPNPSPALGVEGCRKIADFWVNLSPENDIDKRSELLQQFYFEGIDGVAPAIKADHFLGGENKSGRIRMNARVDITSDWVFFEYHLEEQGACAPSCKLQVDRSTIKDTPFPLLAGSPEDHPLAEEFQNYILEAIDVDGKGLLADNMTALSLNLPDKFNLGRQHSSTLFAPNVVQSMSPTFAKAIQTKLDRVGSDLTPGNIISRVHALTCAGCHNQLSQNLGAPLALDSSQQLVEFLSLYKESSIEGERFQLKESVKDTLVPERKQFLQEFLDQSEITINVF